MCVDFPNLFSLMYTTKSLSPVLCRYEVDFEHPNLFMIDQELTIVIMI